MNVGSEIIRSVLRWCLSTVQEYEAERSSAPGPRLAQMRLGDLMSRADPTTCAAIADELIALRGRVASEAEREAMILTIRRGWGDDGRRRTRRRGDEDSYNVACQFISRCRRLLSPREWLVVETCCRHRTWTKAAAQLSLVDGTSARDEFERLSGSLYRAEKNNACETANFALKVGMMRRLGR